ncbi:protein L7/L12 [Seminavis robusta]|uniref:Protein L7/L12 n=1 Tax=Seminavis robusta TaxID=568900 RepID=A0A9N8DDP3_9STRA|nr:protein L7/L12 [Seminavis robusta]|eukprot:Sro25_g017220.1 protein L7/L12 (293) ;mRNA; f:135344-136222
MKRYTALQRQALLAWGRRHHAIRVLSVPTTSDTAEENGNIRLIQSCQKPSPQVTWVESRQNALHHYPLSSQASVRWFSSDGKKEKEAAAAEQPDNKEAPAESKKEEDDDVPVWQNPLHHNNPEAMKQLPEDHGPGEEMIPQEAPPLEDPNNPDKVLASQELYDLSDEIVHLSMLEMKELIDKIGNHFGFEKPPFTGSSGADGDGVEEDAEDDVGEEEAAAAKTAFDLKLVSFDPKSKIKVIKEVRALANLGLKEAKEMVEGAPKTVLKDISKEQAEEMAKKLEEVGGTVEVV